MYKFNQNSQITFSDFTTMEELMELMEMLECIEDNRQQSKVKYSIKEIVLIVFCCTLSNVDDWEDMEIWENHYIDLLREYLEYANGIPSYLYQ